MPQGSPRISVVMTAYNSGPYIKEAIESVLTQTFEHFEFLIVDDASQDNTAKIIQSFSDDRIVYLKNEKNLGQTKSLNIAIKGSRGKYVARMDADDICFPERFQMQYDFLEKHQDISIVGSWVKYINAEGKVFRNFKVPTDPLEIRSYLTGSGDLSFWCMLHPTIMMRKSVFDQEGLYAEEKGEAQGYPQDYELWSRLFMTYQFSNIPQYLLKYRILKGSDSRKFQQMSDRLEISEYKIKHVLPDREDKSVKRLARMLEFLPQASSEDGKNVLSLFDQYFGKCLETARADDFKERLKLFYVPQLFKTNKWLAVQTFFRAVGKYPLFIIEVKFYRKLFKSFLIK
jgi:glycosyltransferase involved in cell wall biosynthesis